MRGARPGKNVQLTENEIRGLCLKSREIFLSQPILLELEAPLKICGTKLKFGSRVLMWLISLICRGYTRTVLRSVASVRIRRFSTWIQLPVPRRLRGSWQTIVGNDLPAVGVQNQVSGELFPAAWQPRMRLHQPYLRFLRRMQTTVRH